MLGGVSVDCSTGGSPTVLASLPCSGDAETRQQPNRNREPRPNKDDDVGEPELENKACCLGARTDGVGEPESEEARAVLQLCGPLDAPGASETPAELARPDAPEELATDEVNTEETSPNIVAPEAQATQLCKEHAVDAFVPLLERLSALERATSDQKFAHSQLAEEVGAFQGLTRHALESLQQGSDGGRTGAGSGSSVTKLASTSSPCLPHPSSPISPLETSCDMERFEADLVAISELCMAKLDTKFEAESKIRMASLQQDMTEMREDLAKQCCEEVAWACEEIVQRCCDEAVDRINSCPGSQPMTALQRISEDAETEPQQEDQPLDDFADVRGSCAELSRELMTLCDAVCELRTNTAKSEKLYARQAERKDREMAGLRGDFQAWSATAGCELDLLRDEFRALMERPSRDVLASPPPVAVADAAVSTEEAEPLAATSVKAETSAISSQLSSPASSPPASPRRPRCAASRSASGTSHFPSLRSSVAAPLSPAVGVSDPASLRGVSAGFGPRVCMAAAAPAFSGAFSGRNRAPVPAICGVCVPLERTDTNELAVLSSRDPWHDAEPESLPSRPTRRDRCNWTRI